jgi:DNA topoisomerase-1
MLVTEKLDRHFTNLMDVNFTAGMEDKLDQIENGENDWKIVLGEFHKTFENELDAASKEMKSEKGKTPESVEKCNDCIEQMIIRWGRFGRFLACPKCGKTKSLFQDTVTNEKCEKCGSPLILKRKDEKKTLYCSAYPVCDYTSDVVGPKVTDVVCEKCGKNMVIRMGRRGEFLACPGFPKCRNAKPLRKDMSKRQSKKNDQVEPSEDDKTTDEEE